MNEASHAADPIEAIALLDEPKRRRLYEYVTARAEPVGRDEAAAAMGIGRELAAFHLDRLVDGGLLDTEYRRLGGRRGPGAGRPAKLYRRSGREVSLSLPARDYERVAEVFAEALDRLDDDAARAAVEEVARARGQRAGEEARASADEAVEPATSRWPARGRKPEAGRKPAWGRGPGAPRLRDVLVETLGAAGYEPRSDDAGRIRLGNCPYHALSATHRELTCGMNLAWAQGLLEGLADPRLSAELAPEPGYCCVVFREAPSSSSVRRS